MRSAVLRLAAVVLLRLAALDVQNGHAAPIVLQGSGPDAAAIQGQVDAFRAAVGNPNNANNPGPLASGRREINWDGGGTATTVSPTPFNGFQNIRGALFATPGTGFVQAPDSGLETQFGNPSYQATFEPFSPARLFTPIGSNVTDVTFSIPGTNGGVPAAVSAFGAIFSDVDLANVTSLAYFGLGNAPLGTFAVPNFAGNETFSFLGVRFDAGEQIARVRITTGNTALGPDDTAQTDVVVMDDFIYAEPQTAAAPIPEPGTMTLLALGLAGARFMRPRRR